MDETTPVRTLEKLADKKWVTIADTSDVQEGDVFRILENGNKIKHHCFKAVGHKDGKLVCEEVVVTSHGTVIEPSKAGLIIDESSPYPVSEKQETCEGCRYLKVKGIPKWICKKLKKHTGFQWVSGYPTRSCNGEYRK